MLLQILLQTLTFMDVSVSELVLNKTQSMSAPLVTQYNKYMACTCLKEKTTTYDYAAIRVMYSLNHSPHEDTVYLKMNSRAISETESRFDAVILFEYVVEDNRYIHLTVICEARTKRSQDKNWVTYDITKPSYTPFICESGTTSPKVQRIVDIHFEIPDVINAAPLSMRLHPNNMMMDMYERERYHSLYYEYEEGERVTVQCSTPAITGHAYYLEFNGTGEWNKTTISKELVLTSADDYTLFECSLCYEHCAKDTMRQIHVLFRLKTPPPANYIRFTTEAASSPRVTPGLTTNGAVTIGCASAAALLVLMIGSLYYKRRQGRCTIQRVYERTLNMRPGLVTPIPSVSSRSPSLLEQFPTSTYDYAYCGAAADAIAVARARQQAINAAMRRRYSDASESHQYTEIDEKFVEQLKTRLNVK